MWQSILYPPIFSKVIDMGLSFLFNWQTHNISTSQKLAAYPHLYSFTSTKSVVHWFQIIRTKSFQMYDDDVQPPLMLSSSSKYTKVAKYPTRNIKTPIVLVYGGIDSLVDIKVMLRELPSQTVATEIPHYEHLDFLWARDVDAQVFQHVFDALESFTGAEHTKEEYERYRSARHVSLSASASFNRFIPNKNGDNTAADSDVSTAVAGSVRDGDEQFVNAEERQERLDNVNELRSMKSFDTSRSPKKQQPLQAPHQARESPITTPVGSFKSASGSMLGASILKRPNSRPTSPMYPGSLDTRFENNSRPDSPSSGRSPDSEYQGALSSITPPKRRGTGTSQMSLNSLRGGKGISLGASESP